jgi:para-nitrobenzyl esterase
VPLQRTTRGSSARVAAIILAAGALAACSPAAGPGGGAAASGAAASGAPASGAAASPAASGTPTAAPAGRGGPVAVTGTGRVQGTVAGAVDEFLGIPYAAPPVGALRWAPPQPAAHWTGIRAATSFAPHCPQTVSPFGRPSTSEDCLFLNVYRPSRGPAHRPVMVWIHGGALVTGESDGYDPAGLVRRGVVVVTINYRLGALGFLADGALAARPGGPAGNYGLMDQQAALRWVRANIARFGGSPRNVTIFGESAGGLSVLSQVVSPGARGLFQRAIVESGAYALKEQPLAQAEQTGAAFAATTGCAKAADAGTAACLRALPVATILADQNATGYQPDVDGAVLTRPIGAALASGHFNRVPLINGTNHDEWRFFVGLDTLLGQPPVTAANYVTSISNELSVPQAVAQQIAGEYPVSSFPGGPEAIGAAGTDAAFACPALLVDAEASKYVPVHAYEFSDENAPERFLPPLGFPYGAAHASEIQYLLRIASAVPGSLNASQRKLAAAMRAYWASLALRGTPNGASAPFWPAFHRASQRMISLVPPRPRAGRGFSAAHHCAFWASLASSPAR